MEGKTVMTKKLIAGLLGLSLMATPVMAENYSLLGDSVSPNVTNTNDFDAALKSMRLFQELNTAAALSGDTVGNGHVIQDDIHTDIDVDDSFNDLFLSPDETRERNESFQNLLDELGINPNEMRSGDTVGNGGGLLEAQAKLAYVNLSKHIISSFEQNLIPFSNQDRDVLMKILNGLAKNPSPEKILFMSDTNHPGFFFKPGFDPAPRVAKTGFSLDFPIFINREMVYQRLDMNSRFWIGLLIHEMGHQVGVRNHGYLDQLGALVVAVSEMNRTELNFTMAPRKIVELSLYNHDFMDATPDLTVTHNGKIHYITSWRSSELVRSCGPYLTFSGLSLSNLHWRTRGEYGPGTAMSLKAGAWAQVKCMDMRAGVFYNQVIDIDINFVIDEGKTTSEVKMTSLN